MVLLALVGCGEGTPETQDTDDSATTDTSPPPTCGNGVLDEDEACDIGISEGEGACPATCASSDECTTAVLSGSDCSTRCVEAPITEAADDDGCCPTGENANTDLDCEPECGNEVVESGEACDDGNTDAGDRCSDCQAEPVMFRMDSLDWKAPRVWMASTDQTICADITDTVTQNLMGSLTSDGDQDGFLDLTRVMMFRPLDPQAGTPSMAATAAVEFGSANCAAGGGITCAPDTSAPLTPTTATNVSSGVCLEPESGTASAGVTNAISPCFSSESMDLFIEVLGLRVPLTHARIGATYWEYPVSSLNNGLLSGFLSEADAEAAVFPPELPDTLGGASLASVLVGGQGSCATGDDRTIGPDGSTRGWWVYLNFTAAEVAWTGP